MLKHSIIVIVFSFFAAANVHAMSAEQIEMLDHHNQPFKLNSLNGKVVLMAFGFTSCEHVCPIEMGRLSLVLRQLEDRDDQVHAVFITVDRDTDDPATLKEYVTRFHDNITGLTGTQQAMDAVADEYRVKRVPLAGGNIDHGASLFVLDRAGIVQAAVPPGLPASHIVSLVTDMLDKK